MDVLDAESDIAIINRTTERMINYARTGASVRRNSSLNGQQRNGNQPSNNSGGTHAQTSQSQGTKGLVSQPSQSNRQGSDGTGAQNRTNSGANQTRNAQKVKFSREAADKAYLDAVESGENDIRFSREFIRAQMTEQEKHLQQVNKALEKDNAKLQEDNQYLKQLLKLQKEVTGGTKFTKSSVETMARQLKTKANASGETKELATILNSFYEFIATSKELSWEDVMEKAQVAA